MSADTGPSEQPGFGPRSQSGVDADPLRSQCPTIAPNGVLDNKEPGRFSLFSLNSGASVYFNGLDSLLSPKENTCSPFGNRNFKGPWWLDVIDPSGAELHALGKELFIHPLTCEDIRTGETSEKVEVFKTYYFVSFRSFDHIKYRNLDHIKPVNVYIVVFPQGLISFTSQSSPHAANVRSRVRKLRNYVALSSDWICYALIDDIVDKFSPIIDHLEKETSAIEDGVFLTRQHELSSVLSTVHVCRKKTTNAIYLLRGKQAVVKSLARCCGRACSNISQAEIELFFSDIQDHVTTMASKLGHCEEILSRSHSDYLARLSVERIGTGNVTMKFIIRITVIAAIIVPLNVICGLFGMNVRVPGGDNDGLSWWFGILGVITFIVLASLVVARKARVL